MRDGVFVTGGTGFLGSYAIARILQDTELPVFAMVRARDRAHALERLWEALQLNLPDEDAFWALQPRLHPIPGDLHAPRLGLSDADHQRVMSEVDSVLHVAASLNRKSPRSCFNTNLRGSLSVLKLASALAAAGRLQRFTNVSTAAVAGKRQQQIVEEDRSIEWDRSDYDPYARTKKFVEHMSTELLDDALVLTLRPSSVLGDSRHDACWITDMVRAFCVLADLPAVPLDPDVRQDLVAGDWVGAGIARLHLKPELPHHTFHLSMGANAPTGRSLAAALAADGERLRFVRTLADPFHVLMRALDRLPRSKAQQIGAVMKVFWPYMTNDVVFDNQRASAILGPPPRFEDVCPGMVRYARSVKRRNVRVPLERRR